MNKLLLITLTTLLISLTTSDVIFLKDNEKNEGTKKCPKIDTCSTVSLNANESCVQAEGSITEGKRELSSNKCIVGKKCDWKAAFDRIINNNTVKEEKMVRCLDSDKVEDLDKFVEIKKLPGEKCESDDDCADDRVCEAPEKPSPSPTPELNETEDYKVCHGKKKGEDCTTNNDCNVGTYCDDVTDKCVDLKKTGEICKTYNKREESDCVDKHYCGKKDGENDYTCQKFGSYKLGEYVRESTHGLLCEEGLTLMTNGVGYCSKITLKEKEGAEKTVDGLVKCDIDEYCEYEVDFGEVKGKKIFKQKCQCSLTLEEGVGICPPYTEEAWGKDSAYGQSRLPVIAKNALSTSMKKVFERYDIYRKGNLTEQEGFIHSSHNGAYFNQVKGPYSDRCMRFYSIMHYYNSTECDLDVFNYEECTALTPKDDDDSSSAFMKISFVFMAFLILILF